MLKQQLEMPVKFEQSPRSGTPAVQAGFVSGFVNIFTVGRNQPFSDSLELANPWPMAAFVCLRITQDPAGQFSMCSSRGCTKLILQLK